MHSWVRAFGVLAVSTVLALSCTDANNPFAPDRGFQVQLAPRYAETAVSIGSEPITEIRLTVKNASTGEVIRVETRVASEMETPDGSAWEVELEVTPPSDGSDVTILMELLNAAGETEWSGETGAIAVSSGSSSIVEDVEIFPGPPANLSVETVEITTAPVTLLEGDTSRLAASITGGEEGARVVWSSITADLASVDGDGLATALLPGLARIQAAAGPAADTVELGVLARPDSVLVTPATAVLGAIGAQVQIQAAVVDARADTLAGEAVTWRVADPAVVSDLGDGRFEAVSTGQTEATVLVASDTTVRTVVPLTVAVPNLVAARASVTTTLPPDTVVEGDSMTVDLAIRNEGTAEAGATTYALQVLDPADLTVVDDTTVALNALAAGDSLVASHTLDTDALSHWPDSVRFRMVVDDGGLVVEADETDNTSTTGVFQLRRAVGSVVVSPAVDTLTRVGDTVRFTAEVLATDGSPLPGRIVTWSSSNTAVATVDGSGLATAVDFGSALTRATSEDVSGTGELVVESTVPAGFTRQWLGGDPAGPTAWSVAGNWDPIGVPTLADTILILSAAANQPVLDVDGSVGGLTVEPGASLDLASFTLTVDGSVSAGQTIVGAGTLAMSGIAATLSGTVSNLLVQGDVSLAGATTATGVVRVEGTSATLAVAGHTLTADSLHVANQGLLAMTSPSDTVRITTGAYFAGRSTTGSMTDGQLEVEGSFSQIVASHTTSFDASGVHRTVLGGAAAQTVSLGSPESGFHHLTVENATGVSFPGQTELSGDLTLAPSAVVSAGDVRVAGSVSSDGTSSLTLTRLHVGGVMNALGTYSVATTRYTGTGGQVVQAGLPYQVLEVTGDAALGGAVAATGRVWIDGTSATLAVAGQTLAADSLHVDNEGLLVMTSPGDTVRIAGGAVFRGRASTGSLTDGQLEVGGSFRQLVFNYSASFDASGAHTTVLNGTAAQSVSFASTASSFHHLTVDNATGIGFSAQTELSGDLTLAPSAVVTDGDVRAAGGVSSDGTSSLTLTRLYVGGVMDVQGGYNVPTTRYTGTGGQAVQAGLPYEVIEVTGDAALGGAVAATGRVWIDGSGATLTAAGQTLAADSLHVDNQGLLVMTSPGDTVRIAGGAVFRGRASTGSLTDGQLEVGGSFSQVSFSHATSFDASGNHTTVLNGTAAQSVSFGSTASSFHHLRVENAVGVAFPTVTSASGTLELGPDAVVASGDYRTTGGVTTDPTSTLTLNPLHVGGVMDVQGAYNVPTTRYTGTGGQVVQAGLPYEVIEVTGDAVLGGAVDATGRVWIDGTAATLGVGGQTLTADSLHVDNQGLLAMTSLSDTVRITGGAYFAGRSTTGSMTDGQLEVGGSFTQIAGDATSFDASGAHRTVLAGAAAQTVSFGSAESGFHHLRVENATGVSLLGTAHADGDFTVTDGAIIDSGTGTLVTGGQVSSGASSVVTLQTLELVDDTMSIGGDYSVGTTVFSAVPDELSPQILQQGLAYQNVTVRSVARYPTDVASTLQTIAGNLTVSGAGALFTPGSCVPVTIQGNLATELGGAIQMDPDPLQDCSAERITVDGNATFGGGSTDGLLTGSVLTVAGDFTETVTDAFVATGSHGTVLSGTGTVTFADTQPSQFRHLTISGTITVPETSWVSGNLSVTGSGSATGAGALRTTGNVTAEATTTLGVDLVSVAGTLDVQGTFSVTTMIFSGGTLDLRQQIQPDLPYANIVVLGAAQFPDFTTNTPQTLSGNLVVQGLGDFRPGACVPVTVGGNLDIQVNGTLTMGNPECSDDITVSGNAIFGGGDTSTTLTDGVLRVAGDLTQTGTNSTASFSPSGLHQVVLNGTGAQTISFENPGAATSHFNDLEILNGSETITLSSDVFVTGTLTTSAGATLTSSAATLNTNDVNVNGMTLDNVLFELVNPSSPVFDNVMFSANYTATATQFLVQHPGSLTTFSFTGLTFLTAPSTSTTEGFYLVAEDTAVDGSLLTIDMLSPDPLSPPAGTTSTIGEATITWPAP